MQEQQRRRRRLELHDRAGDRRGQGCLRSTGTASQPIGVPTSGFRCTADNVTGLVLAVILTVYLVAALVFPEGF